MMMRRRTLTALLAALLLTPASACDPTPTITPAQTTQTAAQTAAPTQTTAQTTQTAAQAQTTGQTTGQTGTEAEGIGKTATWDILDRTPPGPPWHEATRAQVVKAIAILEGQVRAGASQTNNGWALAHGLVAFGPEHKAASGEPAPQAMVRQFAEVREVAGRQIVLFPANKNDQPVEPHPHLLIKSMTESGVPLETALSFLPKPGAKTPRTITLDGLITDAAWSFTEPMLDSARRESSWWTAAMLEARVARGTRTLTTQKGPLDMTEWSEQVMQALEADHAFIEPLLKQGRPDLLIKNTQQPIYAHACGGTHAVQTALRAAALAPEPQRAGLMRRARHQLDLLLFRWDAERRITRQLIASQSEDRMLALVQESKLHGHLIETLARAQQWGLWGETPRHKQIMRRVIGDYLVSLDRLASLYLAQEKLHVQAEQVYFDLIGDGCHALRGLKLALTSTYAPTDP